MSSTTRRLRSTGARRVLLVVAVAVVTAVAVVFVSLRGERRDIAWAPVEAGADGRSLVILPVASFSTCDGKATARIDQSAGGVRVSYRYHPCASKVQHLPQTITVSLGQRLNGASFTGLNRAEAMPLAYNQARYPRLVGLNVSDAREILQANKIPLAKVTDPQGRQVPGRFTGIDAIAELSGFNVTRQTPAGASPRNRKAAAVELTTAYARP